VGYAYRSDSDGTTESQNRERAFLCDVPAPARRAEGKAPHRWGGATARRRGSPRNIGKGRPHRGAPRAKLRPLCCCGILLDRDQWGLDTSRDQKVAALAAKHKLRLIWQGPCHEGFLLRHLPGCASHRPMTAKEALRRLKAKWPDYEKGAPADYLCQRLTATHLLQTCAVESDLCDYLNLLGYFDLLT
jgi:hypothetical protein